MSVTVIIPETRVHQMPNSVKNPFATLRANDDGTTSLRTSNGHSVTFDTETLVASLECFISQQEKNNGNGSVSVPPVRG